jgi:hypothetical protein
MNLTFAGVPLRQTTLELESWVDRNIPARDVFAQDVHYFPGPEIPTVPLAWIDNSRPWEINTLYWPRGAERWAYGFFLIEGQKLSQVLAQVFVNGYAKQPLVMDDGVHPPLTTNLWLLPPRPLQDGQLYLLPLVDDRFFWWARNTGTLTVVDGTTTWATVFASLGTSVGVTINVDPINGNYLGPSAGLVGLYGNVPRALDLSARSVGQRIVRDLNGTVSSLSYTSSAARQTANITLGGNIAAGGFLLTNTFAANALDALVPQKVEFVFPQQVSGVITPDAYVYDVTLASLGLVPFTNRVGYVGEKTLRVAAIETAGNQASLNSHAQQWATDWYLHALGTLDAAYNGLVALAPEGLSVRIEWSYRPDGCRTRLYRGGIEPDNVPLPVATSDGSISTVLNGPSIFDGPTYFTNTTVTITNTVFNYGTTNVVSVSPPGGLTIPTIIVTGAPTWSPTYYEIVWNKVDKILYVWDGSAWDPITSGSSTGPSRLYASVSSVLVSNTVTTTSVLSGTLGKVKANSMSIGSTVDIDVLGFMHVNTGGSDTLKIDVLLGGTIVYTTGTIANASLSGLAGGDGALEFVAKLTCVTTGSSGSVNAMSTFRLDPGSLDLFDPSINTLTQTTTINTTIDNTVDVQVTWGNANAGDKFQQNLATVYFWP